MSTTTEKPKTEKDPNVFVLKNVRLSFPHLFKASAMEGSDPKFSAVFLLDKENPEHQKTISELNKRISEITLSVCKVKTLGADKVCLRDGDEKSDKDGYENHMYLSASDTKKPQVVDQSKAPMDADDPRMFAGVYVNGVVRIWGQSNQWGKRVNASLSIVQYVRTGEAFGAAPLAVDDYLDAEPDEQGGGLL